MSIISHPNGWNGFAVKCVSQRANLTIAHTTYRYTYTCKDSWTKTLAYLVSNRALLGKGGGTAPSRWIANCQPKRTLCVLEVIRKNPDSKKKNSMSIKSCIYIVRKELSIFACVCVCLWQIYTSTAKKKKGKEHAVYTIVSISVTRLIHRLTCVPRWCFQSDQVSSKYVPSLLYIVAKKNVSL